MGLFRTPWYKDPRLNSEGLNASTEPAPEQPGLGKRLVAGSAAIAGSTLRRLREHWRLAAVGTGAAAVALAYALGFDFDDLSSVTTNVAAADMAGTGVAEITPDAPPEVSPEPPETKVTPEDAQSPIEPGEPNVGEQKVPEHSPEQKTADEVRRARMVADQTYETARLNISQIAEETAGAEPTPEALDAFRPVLAARLGIEQNLLTDEMLSEVLKQGGYTTPDGQTFEIWQNSSKPEFYFIDNPNQVHPTIGGDESFTPTPEMSDVEVAEVRLSAAQLGNVPMSELAGENPFRVGTPEYGAFDTVQEFLKRHDTWLGDGWKHSPITVSEYFIRAGIT